MTDITTTANTTTTTRPDTGGPDDIYFDIENTEQDHLITPDLQGCDIGMLRTTPIGEYGGVPLYLDRYGLRSTPPDDIAALPDPRAVTAARGWLLRYAPPTSAINTDTTSLDLAGSVQLRHHPAADKIQIRGGDVILAAVMEGYYLIPDCRGADFPKNVFFAAEIADTQKQNI